MLVKALKFMSTVFASIKIHLYVMQGIYKERAPLT